MNFYFHVNLINFQILLQIVVFLGDLCQCSTLTYRPSSNRCKGKELGEKNHCKCNENERLGRIKGLANLQEIKNSINDSDSYWIGLSYEKNKGFCWITEKHDRCTEHPADQDSLTNIIEGEKSEWNSGWYCFLTRKEEPKMQAKKCNENNDERFICEKESPSSELSPKHSSSDKSMRPETKTNIVTATDPTSIAKSSVVMSSLPSLTTSRMSIEIPTTIYLANVTTVTLAGVASLLLSSTPVNSGFTSNMMITEPIIMANSTISEALITPAALSSQREVLTDRTEPSGGKLSSRDELQRYHSVIRSLNASSKTSFQIARNATSSLIRSLKNDKTDNNDINILSAIRQLETFAISYGRINLKVNENKLISNELFAMKIHKVPADNKKSIIFSVAETKFSGNGGKANISLPPGLFKGQDSVVVSTLYDNIKRWIPASKHAELDGKYFSKLKLRSRVIAGAVYPEPSGILEENITISFSYDEETLPANVPHCVFWDFNRKSEVNGSWSGTGCSLIQSDEQQVTCSCNHLTNFAVLMQVGDKTMSTDHKLALDVITYVGCGLSLAGELLTIIAYLSLMNLKQEQIQIHFNLVVAIAIAQFTFLCGVDFSELKGVCIFVATLIHYFYLAGFVWMLFEGIYLYLMVIKVFNTVVKMRLFYAISWGFPLFMVVLSLLVASGLEEGINSYVHGEFCWVSFSNNLIWTFVAPVLAVCMINSGLLTRVIYEIICMQGDRTSEFGKIRQGSKAMLVLFPLLGLTWVFGILSVTDTGLVFQYIFTILNSLQGFFIFLLHVLKNGEVRAAFRRKKKTWMELRNISTSRVSSHSMTVPNKKLSEEEANELKNMGRESNSSVVGYINRTCVKKDRTLTPVQM
ncbi:adhesion G-protein coupled receptor D1-like [Pocillopora damicornis]|uniref:adhesion G-protein coupled receptor D1-like n=1 Tax=Pocillopora damicornis TaxID=46731 RepID=UPI000F553DE3|nr:adhesion G-protein coupled receptor D1-like [Pocillopora damicornis]